MMILIYNCKCKSYKISLCINMSKRKQYSIHFKYNIINEKNKKIKKEVDEGLLNNQELCKIHNISPYLLSKSLEK